MHHACMSLYNATKFQLAFENDLIGKPISKKPPFNTHLITELKILETEPECFMVKVIAESDEEHSLSETYLLNYLIEFEISFIRNEFGLPEID